jgi:hypothetical protein
MRRLFEPNTRAIGRPPGPTECDAVPDSLIDGAPSELRSANRTCEMGLLHATGRPYQSFVFLLEELSRAGRPSSLEKVRQQTETIIPIMN